MYLQSLNSNLTSSPVPNNNFLNTATTSSSSNWTVAYPSYPYETIQNLKTNFNSTDIANAYFQMNISFQEIIRRIKDIISIDIANDSIFSVVKRILNELKRNIFSLVRIEEKNFDELSFCGSALLASFNGYIPGIDQRLASDAEFEMHFEVPFLFFNNSFSINERRSILQKFSYRKDVVLAFFLSLRYEEFDFAEEYLKTFSEDEQKKLIYAISFKPKDSFIEEHIDCYDFDYFTNIKETKEKRKINRNIFSNLFESSELNEKVFSSIDINKEDLEYTLERSKNENNILFCLNSIDFYSIGAFNKKMLSNDAFCDALINNIENISNIGNIYLSAMSLFHNVIKDEETLYSFIRLLISRLKKEKVLKFLSFINLTSILYNITRETKAHIEIPLDIFCEIYDLLKNSSPTFIEDILKLSNEEKLFVELTEK